MGRRLHRHPRRASWYYNGAHGFFTVGEVPSLPFTMTMWIHPTANTKRIGGLFNSSDSGKKHEIIWNSSGTVGARSEGGGSGNAVSSNTGTNGAWNHLSCIWTSTADRQSVLNGDWANRGTNTDTSNPTGLDRIGIGGVMTGTPLALFIGGIGVTAVWDIALVQKDVEGLYFGRLFPSDVRPANLIALYYGDGNFPLVNQVDPSRYVMRGLHAVPPHINGEAAPIRMPTRSTVIGKAPDASGIVGGLTTGLVNGGLVTGLGAA
jgi:hypothetical protein